MTDLTAVPAASVTLSVTMGANDELLGDVGGITRRVSRSTVATWLATEPDVAEVTVYSTAATLLASVEAARGTGSIWQAKDGTSYEEVASGEDVTTAGLVKLSVRPMPDGSITPDQFKTNAVPGTTDMTTALSAAFNWAAGTTVRLLPTTYAATSTITMSAAGVTVSGPGATIAGSAAVATYLLRINAENVTLDGFAASVANTTADVVSTAGGTCSGFTARRLTVTGGNYGISANRNSNITLEGNVVSGSTSHPIRCHNFTPTEVNTNIRIIGNRLDTSDQEPTTSLNPCLLVRGDTTYVTTNVLISGNRFICPLSPTNTEAMGCEFRHCKGVTFSGNYALNGSMLVSCAGSSDVAISGNTSVGASAYAIEVAGPPSGLGCFNVAVTGNAIDGQERLTWGVGVQGVITSRGVTVTGNSIRGVTLYGVLVTNQWSDVTISGNTIDITSTNTNQFGIYFSGAVTAASIAGNMLNGGTVGEKGIYVIDGTSVSIAGNTTRGWTENDIFLRNVGLAPSNISITGNSLGSGLSSSAIAVLGTMGVRVSAVNNPSFRRSNTEKVDVLDWLNDVIDAVGTVAPETNVTAGGGSIYRRRGGGTGATLYVKEDAASDAVGWVAK